LVLSILLIAIHYFLSGHATEGSPLPSDSIAVHAAPEHSCHDIIKPANGVSFLMSRAEMNLSAKDFTPFEFYHSKLQQRAHDLLLIQKKFIPIFLSNKVIRI